MMPRGLFTFAAIAVVGAGAWFGMRAVGNAAPPVAVGAFAPDFKATEIGGTGQVKGIADYKGDVVLVNLWATWCVPCVTEMPSIQRLYDRFRDQGFRVVGIAVDDPPYAERVATFVRDHGLSFEILHEGSGMVEQDYRARGIPATYVIGRDGRIRVIRQGASDWDSEASRAVVAQLLRRDPAEGARPTP
ncbi:MAG: TlpA family protein disulfide reductase [Cytophagaceae bacterium]|nr:TlpA family protein disulfide reductase [Gemmatimonadaceae bacterium]